MKILDLYRESVTKVPILRYSWVIITTICLLAIIAVLKLNNFTVLIYAVAVIFVTFTCFAFSWLIKSKGYFSRIVIYAVITPFVITNAIAILGLGSFIIFETPKFYKRWFKDEKLVQKDTLKINEPKTGEISTKPAIKQVPGSSKNRISKESRRSITMSIQLSLESNGYSALFLDGVKINTTLESTRFNPRIEVKDYQGLGKILIVTNKGDSCWTTLPRSQSNSVMRIVPNCY